MIEYKQIKDYDSILSMLDLFSKECFPLLFNKISNIEEYAIKLSKFSNFYIMYDKGIPIGISVFYCNDVEGKIGYIPLIGIISKYRQMGLGKTLLDYTIDVMKNNGMNSVRLEVDDYNSNAHAFYIKNGFVDESKSGHESTFMIKKL